MIPAILALFLSWATGWFGLELLWPRPRSGRPDLVLRIAVAGGLGLFASSLLYLISLILGLAERPWVIAFDLITLSALARHARSTRRRGKNAASGLDQSEAPDVRDIGHQPVPKTAERLLGAGLAVAVITNAGAWLQRFYDEPLGFWDAFAIWNLKARFFFFEAGEHWQSAFSDVIPWSHTDYPLLLPLTVARLWTYGGSADQAIAALLSACFTLLAAALLFGAVARAKGRPMGFLVCFALLATPQLMAQSVWQIADIPMGTFLAISLALVLAAPSRPSDRGALLFLAGVSAGAAAWTKNEGLLFAVAIPLSIALTGSRADRKERASEALQFGKGLVIPLGLVLVMKLAAGGGNDLAADFSLASLGRVFEWSRHQLIISSFIRTIVMLAGIPLLVCLIGLALWQGFTRHSDHTRRLAAGVLTLSFQLAGYYFIYLITERDLAWHLGTSNLRLFVQLWPSALLLLFSALRPFHDPPPARAVRQARGLRSEP